MWTYVLCNVGTISSIVIFNYTAFCVANWRRLFATLLFSGRMSLYLPNLCSYMYTLYEYTRVSLYFGTITIFWHCRSSKTKHLIVVQNRCSGPNFFDNNLYVKNVILHQFFNNISLFLRTHFPYFDLFKDRFENVSYINRFLTFIWYILV